VTLARPGRSLLLLLVLGAMVLASAWYIGSHKLADALQTSGQTARQAKRASHHHGASAIERVPRTAWRAVRLPLEIGAAVALGAVAARLLRRWTRRYVRLRLVPYRSDEAQPQEVLRMIETWHQQVLQRWWRRALLGQPGIALEVTTAPDAGGDLAATLSVVCPRSLATAVEGALMGCYPNTRLEAEDVLPRVGRLVRLKKRYHFVRALRSHELGSHHPIDSLLGQMDALDVPSVIQYALTPTPALFDRFSRSRFRKIERDAEAMHSYDARFPGLRSEVIGRELEGGLRVQHHPLFFCDIRVAAASSRACLAVAGTLRGESGAENRLVARHMHGLGRRGLYLRRLRRGVGNPVPGWRQGVLSSIEVGALWQLPSPALKGGRVARSAIPRLPAPPEVSREPGHALLADEHGPVGILPGDKTDGLGLIGGQKTGKTSVLCRTVRADSLDPDCAVIVLMPKPGDALKALSMVPKDRTVRYLDLEHPEFGINPLLAEGEPAMIADKIVEAFRDVHMEGDIRGSSDRYLRQAAQAAVGASRAGAIEGQPTLWDMYRLLIPSEVAFRDRVVEALYPDPRFADTATFFGRELPADLRDASAQTAAKLDAPRNKILRLLVEALDKVLRHPVQLSLDEVVRRREVLIVDGKMGTFGADNCRVMLQFVLNSLYGALQRQQQLPEHQRARVALKVDEAHLILNESFADALATLRSAGLEVVAAWQYGEQIQNPKIRAGMLSLLRQRCMFSMGETQDARELSSIAMDVYADVIHATAESQKRLRMAPDTIFNLPNTYAVCSWISRGARAPAFVARTMALETDEGVIQHHLEAQRASGAYVPDHLPDPLPDAARQAPRDLPVGVVTAEAPAPGSGARANGNGRTLIQTVFVDGNGVQAPPLSDPVALDFGATSIDNPNERAAPTVGAPDSYTELDFDRVRGMIWDKVTALPADRRHEPSKRELEILAALHSYRFLFATQLWRRWWPGSSLRAAQQGLNRMAKAGWVRRFKFQLAERGAQQRVYCLRREGFELAQRHSGRHGAYVDPETKWREPEIADPRRVLRDLHLNGWVLAFEQVAGNALVRWRGGKDGRLEPPRRREHGVWVDLTPAKLEIEGSRRLVGFGATRFEPVSPDATLEIRINVGESPLRFDLLVELDRSASAAGNENRLRRYDGLISGWAARIDRYRAFGTLPAVVFVCEDERSRDRLVRIADRTVTARHAKAGTPESEWPFPGRGAMFFALERDVHEGSLAAVQLQELPPEARVQLGGRGSRECRPRNVQIIEPRLLGRGSRRSR
jgi:hypothetical protein